MFKFIAENYKQDWKQFAEYLKLSPNLIDKCYDVSSVLSCFENNCVGISNQEIIYRLKRALERSDENEMKEEISKMMADPTS